MSRFFRRRKFCRFSAEGAPEIDYKDLNIGYILYNFQNLPQLFNDLLIDLLHDYIPTILSIVICLIFLTWLDPITGLISLFGIILMAISILQTKLEKPKYTPLAMVMCLK